MPKNTKHSIPESAEKCPSSAIQSAENKDKKKKRRITRRVISPAVASLRVILATETESIVGKQLDVSTLLDQLREQATAINTGDMKLPEAMLINQAASLENLFTRLTEMAMSAKLLLQFETYMRMALRAQNQCRTTLETLAGIKNPPIVYAKQANVTTGPQQINNGIETKSQVRENEIEPNKLLEVNDGQRLDTRTQSETSGTHQELETLETINRAKNIGRKKTSLC